MLKIKDNVDLKELEKFGFKYVEDKVFGNDFGYYEKPIGNNIVLDIPVQGKLMYVDIIPKESDMTYVFSDGLDVIFELIKSGLVVRILEE